MSALIAYVGGTMDTEVELVDSAASSTIHFPAQPGIPEETYRRIDLYDQPIVRFALTTTTTEGSPA